MGTRTVSRSKRSKPDLWSVAYHLGRPVHGAQTPPGVRGATLPPRDDPAVLLELERLEKRRELIGRNVRIPREWADVLTPSSPVALQPRFDWLGWAGRSRFHDEMRWARWATVLESGEVLKAYSEEGLEKLRRTVLKVKPTMERFGLTVPVFYQTNGWKWVGGCSFVEEFNGITVPEVISISTRVGSDAELLWSMLHELAHLGQTFESGPDPRHPRSRRRGETRWDHQRSLHPESFRRHHGEILAYHLEHHANYFERRQLSAFACSADDYSPPIHPDGRCWADTEDEEGLG